MNLALDWPRTQIELEAICLPSPKTPTISWDKLKFAGLCIDHKGSHEV